MVRPESSRQRPRRVGPIVAAVAATLATGLLASRPAEACGPWFPTTLLDQRSAVLLGLPEGNFDFEAQHLLSPSQPNFKAIESDYYGDLDADRRKAAAEGLSAEQVVKMEAAQAAQDGRAAYAVGEGLPEDLRLYVAGAVDFNHQDKASAEQRFAAVAALPEGERRLRGVWAEFMLGRVIADATESAKHYAKVRELVAAGAPDPAGLAVASLGQEARDRIATDFAGAVRLYAEQASYKSRSGTNSLLFLARDAFQARAELDARLKDALTRRLLVAYALSRPGELLLVESGKSSEDWDAVVAAQNATTAPSASVALLRAVDALKLGEVEGADRLAALAYRNGDYDAAAAWAGKSDAPLSQWVRAKLALRKGDDATARTALAAAAKAFPVDEQWSEGLGQEFDGYEAVEPQCRAQAELGVLALGRGDYTLALAELFKARRLYWSDLAYVAERVVTVDELKTFVDAEVKPAPPSAAAAPPRVRPCAALDRALGPHRDRTRPLRRGDARALRRHGTAGIRGRSRLRHLRRRLRPQLRGLERQRRAGRIAQGHQCQRRFHHRRRAPASRHQPRRAAVALALPDGRDAPGRGRRRPAAAALAGLCRGAVHGLGLGDRPRAGTRPGAVPPLREERRDRPRHAVRPHLSGTRLGRRPEAARPATLAPGEVLVPTGWARIHAARAGPAGPASRRPARFQAGKPPAGIKATVNCRVGTEPLC